MNSVLFAIAVAIVGIALTLAQDAFPAQEFYHSWQYITLLTVAIIVMLTFGHSARIGKEGSGGKPLALAMIGALAVTIAGFVSALIGPDTVTVIGTPGTVTPIPDLRVAAFFEQATPATLADAHATITLRRRDGGPIEIGNTPVPFGLSVLSRSSRIAAYVEARDARGNHLTVTQPNNTSFLSPVLLFRSTQPIAGKLLPFDTFATPGVHRIVRALYLDSAALSEFNHGIKEGGSGVVLSITDDQAKPRGIAIARSGVPLLAGDLLLKITLGRYPTILISSAPSPYAVISGLIVFAGGLLWFAAAMRKRLAAMPASPLPVREERPSAPVASSVRDSS